MEATPLRLSFVRQAKAESQQRLTRARQSEGANPDLPREGAVNEDVCRGFRCTLAKETGGIARDVAPLKPVSSPVLIEDGKPEKHLAGSP
jgi:hypothetical protein